MSDSEDFLQDKFFPLGDLKIDNVDLTSSEPPTNGLEYLKRVAAEASKCEKVVVASINKSKLKKQTVNYSTEEKPMSALAPSREWQVCQVADFSATRMAVSKYWHSHSPNFTIKIPPKDDEAGWCAFCLGSKFAQSIPDLGSSTFFTDDTVEGSAPLMSTLGSFNQPLVEQVLEYHVDWLEQVGFSATQGPWLYALLASLQLPLTPELCSLLRTLARNCALSRDKMADSPDQNLVTALNLLICIVAHYFRQMDLADL